MSDDEIDRNTKIKKIKIIKEEKDTLGEKYDSYLKEYPHKAVDKREK